MNKPFPWQSSQWQQLQQRHESSQMPHALLLHGPELIGKTDFARATAESLLCENPDETGHACGQCKSCQLNTSANHPDFIQISPEEAGKAIKVDQIRELIQQMSFSHHYGKYRIVLITEAHQMNLAAANSLLKTLEEPQSNTVIMLVTSSIHQLPATIRSRCQMIRFAIPESSAARQWLESELATGSESQLLAAANGAPLLAKQIHEKDILQLRRDVHTDLLDILKGKRQPLSVASDWYKSTDIKPLEWMYHWVCDLIKLTCFHEDYVHDQDSIRQLQTLLKTVDLGKLYQFHDQLREAMRLQRTSANRLLLLEGVLLSWTYLNSGQTRKTA